MKQHAIVIGGSMAGLLAARVLIDHFEQVTLVERDTFPAVGENRRGVPQGKHTHGLLAGGAQVLDELFPGFTAEITAAGALPGDIAETCRWFHAGGYLAQVPSGLNGVLASRPLIEGIVRRRILALARVRVLQGQEVTGLIQSGVDVAGVTLAGGATLPADLVVNCGGRASHGPNWLEAMGYARPRTESVEVGIGYTTRLFRRRPEHLNGDLAVIIAPNPDNRRGGVMLAQENDRWTVTLLSYFGNYAPSDLDGFRAYAHSLECPDIAHVLDQAEPIGEALTMRYPASVRQRYEELTRFPRGYLTFGDAICSFNPIYGQGMTSAAMQAKALGECLSDSGNLARRFFRKAAAVVDIPWGIAVGADLRIPETAGPRSVAVNFINWYVEKLHRAAHRDAELTIAFHKVANLLAPPPSLLSPRLAWRVWRGSRSAADPVPPENSLTTSGSP
ncbi:MAG: hypothetical protein K2X03_15355 [Bryobacteraceae bacterium]|nr:hypothetical protein [Bryobacteraceae bacterium]